MNALKAKKNNLALICSYYIFNNILDTIADSYKIPVPIMHMYI